MSFIISALKTRDLCSIRKKLITIYILNVTDIIFTIFLVNTGLFLEANAVMAPLVYNRQLVSIIVKVVIPALLMIGGYQRMKDATEKQLYQSNLIINGCLLFYGFINISHVIWCIRRGSRCSLKHLGGPENYQVQASRREENFT